MLDLWEHQKRGLELAKKERDVAFFWDPGTGKTREVIEILRYLYNLEKKMLRTYIFAPLVVLPNWKAEIKKYSKIPEKQICVLGSGLTGTEKAHLLATSEANIFAINYDALINGNILVELMKKPPHILVCDEVHRVKNIQAKRTKAMIKLADTARRRFILTGTPILNSQLDLFGQFRVLDRGETFGTNYFIFRGDYFYDKNAGMDRLKYFPDWRPRPDTSTRLQEKISRKVSVAKKEDCLDLPPLIETEILVEMTPEQRKAYTQMKEDFITYVNNEACVATLAITKALRLQQIVSGYLMTESGLFHEFKDTPREKALEEKLEDLRDAGKKVLTWAVFKPNYKILEKVFTRLGMKYTMLTGETQDKEKQISRFRQDPEYQGMIAHPGAGGIGVNLVEAQYSIIYSRNFSLEQAEQSKARNYRGGSEIHSKITHFHLIADGTIDRVIFDALVKKKDLSNSILTLAKML